MRLAGKAVIVTGAASGIGEATARLWAAHGARVTIADLSDRGAAVARDIAAGGGDAGFVRTDVASAEVIDALFDAHMARHGALDILMNNASRTSTARPIHETSEAEFDDTVAVDLKSVFLTCRRAAPIMIAARRGVIINISAGSAREGLAWPNLSAYIAAKGGVIALTRALAVELSGFGIRVNSLNPGLVDTPMMRGFADRQSDPAAFWAGLGAMNLMNRMASPQEIAAAALFLASDDASYVTGTDLLVDGGLVLGGV